MASSAHVPAVRIAPNTLRCACAAVARQQFGCCALTTSARASRGNRQLVGDITLARAVPVEVFLVQIVDHGNGRRAAEIARLETRQLDHPPVRRSAAGFEQVEQRQADIAGQRDALSTFAQQVRDQRGDRALALGAGDADRARLGMLGKPQRRARGEAHAGAFGCGNLGA